MALADAGPVVLGLILAIQQLESNVLEPLILDRAIHLHPLVPHAESPTPEEISEE